ncbi:YbfB/YjiJ family MFS transporter [Salinarimonas rosea]|uniref:YbfB/YjiJ family MFS transporter n=1 Tax=Salinarimonas rosea TaxID=552063 RepID=UPI0003FC2E67|nr:YbfB/YjiJ family MFS transporter [Salinarimonas rosea]
MANEIGARGASAGGRLAPWLPALLAVLVGIGFARFAYTPLLPLLVERGWVSAPQAAFAGAANLAGYLVGALLAQALAARRERGAILNAALALAVVSLGACAVPLGAPWGALWLSVFRFLAGVAGGLIMVLGPSAVLSRTPPEAKSRVSGIVFAGVGIGVVLSGALLPALATLGLVATWLALAAMALLLTAIAWRRWPDGAGAPAGGAMPRRAPIAMALLVLAYATDGTGFVPHTLFLSDFVARGLGRGEAAGGLAWTVFGVGALVGAPLCGLVATRIGAGRALVGALFVKAAAVALPLVSTATAALWLSALLVGALTPGMVALAAGLTASLASGPAQARLFGTMTIAFAVAQAAGAYALSALFASSGSHLPLFAAGAAVLAGGGVAAMAAVRMLGRG